MVYLPPYSPDLNPIEECFSFIKAYICRHSDEYCHLVALGVDSDLKVYLFICRAFDQVTASMIGGWFRDSGYFY